MDSMWQAVKVYFGNAARPSAPLSFHTHCCDLKPPRARNNNINIGVEIPEDVMGLFSAIGDTSRPPCTCDGMDALFQHIEDFIRTCPDSRPEDYTLHSGKSDQSVEEVCQYAMRDALQWWTVWHGSLDHHQWKHLYLAFCTISDDIVIPPQDLINGSFRFLGYSLDEVLAGLRSEHVDLDDVKLLEMLIWRQYIVQYLEKVDRELHPFIRSKTTVMTQFRVITAGVHSVAIILLAARGAKSLGPTDAAVEMAAICDCLSMDIAKETLGILNGEKTESVAGRNRAQLKAELRWLYIRCVEFLDLQPGAPLLRRYATSGFIFVPMMDRYRERAQNGSRIPMSSALRHRVDSYRLLLPTACPLVSYAVNDSRSQEPIAIVGMGLRLPGGCHDPPSFWEFLSQKKDARKPIPLDRFNIDGHWSPYRKEGSLRMRHGYFLEEDVDRFDANFFSMSQAEVESLDPQQRLLLEVVYETLESAGETEWRGKNISTFTGNFGQDWLKMQTKDSQDKTAYNLTGADDFALANRLAYEFDLHGPSMSVKVGCSSNMVALHLACKALQNGDCSAAIVGGANLVLTPDYSIVLEELQALSPDASSKAFDESANGYARADAINAIYIKKLSDAIHDGNPIRAIIRATSTNVDGKTPGLSTPSQEAHQSLIRRAYEVAGITDVSATAVVECHGTGTAVGDPIETNAVGNVFGEKGVYIGSVKPNMGHGEGASGLTSVIKSVLALEHKTIIPNIKFQIPNPKIPWERSHLSVPQELTPWPKDRSERISVNSFGITGANAHVILDSASSLALLHNQSHNGDQESARQSRAPSQSLLVFSAHHKSALKKMLVNYDEFIHKESVNLRDLAYTLGARRNHQRYRAFCVTDGNIFEPSLTLQASVTPKLLFVFTGQGAQWPGMGRELLRDFDSFRSDIRAMDRQLSMLAHPPAWTIEEELLKPKPASNLHKTEYAQPLTTAVQLGLVNILRQWNILPSAVVGHSSGEIAAAYSAGVVSMEDAISVAYFRGYVSARIKRPGGMAAVGLGREEVEQYLISGVTIACENSKSSITISGDAGRLEEVLDRIRQQKPNAFVRRLRVDRAYHSDHMKSASKLYEELTKQLVPRTAKLLVPVYSSVTGTRMTEATTMSSSSYWKRNMESPVLFLKTMEAILVGPDDVNLSIEIGPHPALAGPLRQIYNDLNQNIPHVPVMTRDENCASTLFAMAGQLYSHGFLPNFAAMNLGGATLPDLPTYPWIHDHSYWRESRLSREFRNRQFPEHDLLGVRVAEAPDLEPMWRSLLSLSKVPWIQDHVILSDVVFPAAGYVAIAGAAIRQLSGQSDYTVREVTISTALLFREEKSVELVTRLKPRRITNVLNSSWYEFSILSHNGTSWTKHCHGQVHAGALPSPDWISHDSQAYAAFPRQLSQQKWYQMAAKVGLHFGPAFKRLQNIRCDAADMAASTTVFDYNTVEESSYCLHPTIIDQLFQSMMVASCQGQSRKFQNLVLPTYIGELYVGPASGKEIQIQIASEQVTGNFIGKGQGILADGETVFKLRRFEVTMLENERPSINGNPHGGFQLEWMPDIDLLSAAHLVSPIADIADCIEVIERLSFACSIEMVVELKDDAANLEHMRKYQEWNQKRVASFRAGNISSKFISDAKDLVHMDSIQRQALIRSLMIKAQQTKAAPIATAIFRLFESMKSLYAGSVQPLEILLQNDVLTNVYNFWNVVEYGKFMRLIGHSKPGLRVLEIGAGTGGFTSTILPHLQSAQGQRLFSTYTYTDVSAGFLKPAKERFLNYGGLEFAVLDISRDPSTQGFEPGSYDLVIAANVLHATPTLQQTLKNCRTLLQPQGRLFLQELCAETKWINFIMGTLPGWWLGDLEGRSDEPYIKPKQWDIELKKAGFCGVEMCATDMPQPYSINALIVARPVAKSEPPKRVALLVSDLSIVTHTAEKLQQVFESRGYQVSRRNLSQPPTVGIDVISLLDIEGAPFFYNLMRGKFSMFIEYISGLQSQNCGLLWVTREAQISAKNPYYAMILGVGNTIRSEQGTRFATLELDSVKEDVSWEKTFEVFQKFQRSSVADGHLDWEYALSGSVVYVPRYHQMSVTKELCGGSTTKETTTKRLEVGSHGQLQSLKWVEEHLDELGPDDVEVEVRATSLNFHDVMVAMGIVKHGDGSKNLLGVDCAGVVLQTGSAVDHVEVGDRVLCLVAGALATRVKVVKTACLKISGSLSFEEAASMPVVYGTAIRCLIEIGQLSYGQTILIHSAAGGLGIAAIQLAQMLRLETYVTVGNAEKKAFIIEQFGIPESHVLNSRDVSFGEDIMRATKGEGIDFVLNSLSGELLHESWKCVAKYGMMAEVGKRDFIGKGELAMDIFADNRGYFAVDLFGFLEQMPQMIHRLLTRMIQLYEGGNIKPIHPIITFDAFEIQEAFRTLQNGQHIGKIVINFPTDDAQLPVNPAPQKLQLRDDRSYLLVGGLGGLGKMIAIWLVEHGAKHLLFLTRSGKKDSDNGFFNELDAMKCSSQVFSGGVDNLNVVQDALAAARYPIGGVLQMSMVLQDQSLHKMTFEDWQIATMPKVQGTMNLHEALKDQQLDFFVLFSSISGRIGQPGQANYAAGNSFLDAFVQYRQYLGLVASVIDIGVVEESGFVSMNSHILESLRRAGAQPISDKAFLESLHLAITRSSSRHTGPSPWELKNSSCGSYVNPAHFGIGMSPELSRLVMGGLETVIEPEKGNGDQLKLFINSITTATSSKRAESKTGSVVFLAKKIAECVKNFLMINDDDDDEEKEPNLNITLTAMGIDSLVAIEIRNWWKRNLHSERSVLELMGNVTLKELGEIAYSKLWPDE